MRFFPHDLPTCNGGVVFLNVAEDQATVFKRVGTNLTRADVSRIGRYFGQMNNLLLLHVNLVVPTIGERAISGSKLFFLRRMKRVSPFRAVGINQVSTH